MGKSVPTAVGSIDLSVGPFSAEEQGKFLFLEYVEFIRDSGSQSHQRWALGFPSVTQHFSNFLGSNFSAPLADFACCSHFC